MADCKFCGKESGYRRFTRRDKDGNFLRYYYCPTMPKVYCSPECRVAYMAKYKSVDMAMVAGTSMPTDVKGRREQEVLARDGDKDAQEYMVSIGVGALYNPSTEQMVRFDG